MLQILNPNSERWGFRPNLWVGCITTITKQRRSGWNKSPVRDLLFLSIDSSLSRRLTLFHFKTPHTSENTEPQALLPLPARMWQTRIERHEECPNLLDNQETSGLCKRPRLKSIEIRSAGQPGSVESDPMISRVLFTVDESSDYLSQYIIYAELHKAM